MNIWLMVVAAIGGAVLGDNLGFRIGRELSYNVGGC